MKYINFKKCCIKLSSYTQVINILVKVAEVITCKFKDYEPQ